MAGNNTVSSSLPSREYSCKICDLSLDSKDSLDVHLQYHNENLYVKWGTHPKQNDSGENEPRVKIEPPVSAPADSSDNMITKSSPEFHQRATPETTSQFQHPATPQSYHSAPSPYQNPDQTNFSPNPQFTSPQFQQTPFSQNNPADVQQWEHNQFHSEYHKPGRFHPYSIQDRVSQVSSSSPIYSQTLNQPTPSPSPNQCDKCGFVCESALQLTEHCNTAHASNGQGQYHQLPYASNKYQNFPGKVKEEQEDSPDILDLDSQKVVYQSNDGDSSEGFDRVVSRDNTNRHATPMQWGDHKIYSGVSSLNGDSNTYKDSKMYNDQKPYNNDQKFYADKFVSSQHDPNAHKVFIHQDQKVYPGVQIPLSDPYSNPVVSSNPENMKPPYRPFDSPTAPQISSTQQSNPTSTAIPPIGGKGANWKSNEARRPKTYNCTACNKWFTSSGHLKRHYNTTLHKNAVRSSGQPDPATMPISVHHHPTRDQIHSRVHQPAPDSNTQSPSSAEDSRDDSVQSSYTPQGYERPRVPAMNSKSSYSHLQQGNLDNSFVNSPIGNHPHQIGPHSHNTGNQPPDLHSQVLKTNSSTTSPPNGDAGPSVTQNHHLRGLLSVSNNNFSTPVLTSTTPPIMPHTLPPFSHLAVNPYSQRPTDPSHITVQEPAHLYLGQNFQETIAANYPNGMAPHVMDMATNNIHIANPDTTGELIVPDAGDSEVDTSTDPQKGRLPSFAHIQYQIGVILPNYIKSHNVGGYNPIDDPPLSTYFIFDDANNSTPCAETSFADPQPDFPNPSIKSTIKLEPDDDLEIIKLEDIIDYANKENYEREIPSPASPESAKVEYESNGSPSVSSTVIGPPLSEKNQPLLKPTIHKCYECDKVFNRACYLTQHNKSFHSGAKPFKCERCGKRFPEDSAYKEHFKKHAGIKPFKCQECPKSFNHKTDLRRHMCLHSGTKPYVCITCGKGFIRKDHMVKHCDTHRKKPTRQSSSA